MANAVPPAQNDPTPTEEFNIVPSTGSEEESESEGTPTPQDILEEEFPGGWSLPVNLSLSGATSDPQMVRDNVGDFHVLWHDIIDGFVYTTGRGNDWSLPTALELPFFTRRYFPDLDEDDETPIFQPYLIADDGGEIHAFWIDDSDDQQTLYHSRVESDNFDDMDSWSERNSLESQAREIAVSIDKEGRLHLIFIRSGDTSQRPSGIYYRRRSATGVWSNPILLYGSRYLRDVERDEANLQIQAADNESVYIVWDDTRREQIFFTHSANGGTTWHPMKEVDKRSPEDEEEAQGPSQLKVGVDGDLVLLTWRGGHEPGQDCAQYMMISVDSGQNWSLREYVESLPTCLSTAQFVSTSRGLFLLGTTEQAGTLQGEMILTTYLMVWDGSRWSDPQVQEQWTTFTNPDTFQPVHLRCHQAIGDQEQLYTLGCDIGNGRDIWLTSREIGSTEDWFPPPPIWQGPASIGTSSVKVADLQLVPDHERSTHAFWHDDQSKQIYHAAWNGNSWSAGRPVINITEGNVQEISAASANDRLYIVFRNSAGGLYFSQAAITRPSEWSMPLRLSENQHAADPHLIAGSNGLLNLAYTVPLNEERGIYFMQSEDEGESWTLPIQVFNGTDAGWDMVDSPYIAATDKGQLHLLWRRRSLPPEADPLALAYSRSEDSGRNWTEMEVVEEARVLWSRLLGLNQRIVHRLWAEERDERLVLWHEFSSDSGLNWSRAAQVTGLSTETYPALAVDSGNRPHILALDNGRLLDLMWSLENWTPGDNLAVPFSPGGHLAAAGDRNEQLLALYAGQIPDENEDEEQSDTLFAMSRSLEIPPELLVPLPTLTPTPMPTTTPEPTASPTPQPTLAFSPDQERGLVQPIPGLPTGTDASASLILLAIIPAGVIVIISIIVGIRVVRKS